MTMHLRTINPAAPVDLDLAPVAAAAATPPARRVRSAEKPVRLAAVKGAGIVVVVPDVINSIVGVCDAAGLKGSSKLLCRSACCCWWPCDRATALATVRLRPPRRLRPSSGSFVRISG